MKNINNEVTIISTFDNNDFISIAHLHKDLIPIGFLSTFPDYLLINFYRFISVCKYSFLIAVKVEKDIIGFIAGTINSKNLLISFIFNNIYRLDLAIIILYHLIKNKKVNTNKETISYMLRSDFCELPKSEILNFCVSSFHQGKGIGRLLFIELIKVFKANGILSFKIDTGFNQISAQKFYEKMGAIKVKEFELHKDIKSILYIMNINND
jgi:ribosomal protein S18 acetylase RimI-like enzyme